MNPQFLASEQSENCQQVSWISSYIIFIGTKQSKIRSLDWNVWRLQEVM